MSYIPKDQIAAAREMDLLTYLRYFEPEELVHFGGGTYTTRTHDSLKISNGKWNWFSRGIGGKTALDYLVKVRGFSFTQAVEIMAGKNIPPQFHADRVQPFNQEPKVLSLPKASRCAARAISYLHRRGIDYDVINYCVQTGRLYESLPYHNAVFVGRDQQGQPRYAALRGTVGDFKGEAPGSDKRYSFTVAENPNAKSVHLFESAIDLLSYATMLKMEGRDWRQSNLLSLAGVFKQKQVGTVPLALSQYLRDHPGTDTIYLHLDNDAVGRGAAVGIMESLKDRYTVLNRPPTSGKDVNELLQQRLGLTRKREEKERALIWMHEEGG